MTKKEQIDKKILFPSPAINNYVSWLQNFEHPEPVTRDYLEGFPLLSVVQWKEDALQKRGQQALDMIRGFFGGKIPLEENQHTLRYEIWVKNYLKTHGKRYNLEVISDLDETGASSEGDLLCSRNGKTVRVEVEVQDRLFLQHKHPYDGRIVFTIPPKTVDLKTEIVYAEADHFWNWYNSRQNLNIQRTTLFFSIHNLLRKKFQALFSWEVFNSPQDYNPEFEYARAEHNRVFSKVIIKMAEATFSSYAQALNEDLTFHDLIQEAQRALQDSCSTEKKCDNCGGHMLKFCEGEILPPSPLINDVTEGQWADYMAGGLPADSVKLGNLSLIS